MERAVAPGLAHPGRAIDRRHAADQLAIECDTRQRHQRRLMTDIRHIVSISSCSRRGPCRAAGLIIRGSTPRQ